MTVPDLKTMHICFCVADIESSMQTFRGALGVDTWSEILERGPTRVAYGGGSTGIAWELFQPVGEGTTAFHDFLRDYGEGVQHIGLWTPDLLGSVEAALDAGASFVSAARDAAGNALSVQLLPRGEFTESLLPPLGNAFVRGGFGNVAIEYLGRPVEPFLQDWLKDKYAAIVPPPNW